MRGLPEGFTRHRAGIVRLAEGVPGLITRREIEFLVLLGACPTAEGEILEIGSFKGRSTIVLSKAAALAGDGKVVAVDPMGRTASDDGRADGHPPWREAFDANLEAAGVAEKVEFHQSFSGEVAPSWGRGLRLLWIDGLHTYEGVKADFDGFAPHLADGAIIAMHDVLHLSPGPIRVFAEDVLLSDHFGASGLCGAIGWAQYRADPAATRRHAPAKTRLHRTLAGLIPYMEGGEVRGLRKFAYKFRRCFVPHRRVNPGKWLRSVDLVGSGQS